MLYEQAEEVHHRLENLRTAMKGGELRTGLMDRVEVALN